MAAVFITSEDSSHCGNITVGDGNDVIAVVKDGRCTGSDGSSGCGTTIADRSCCHCDPLYLMNKASTFTSIHELMALKRMIHQSATGGALDPEPVVSFSVMVDLYD